jgi:hypothetical protein
VDRRRILDGCLLMERFVGVRRGLAPPFPSFPSEWDEIERE